MLKEDSIKNRNLSTRFSSLKLVYECLKKENLELMSKNYSKSGFKSRIIIAVIILIIVIVLTKI